MAKYKSLLLQNQWVKAGKSRKCYHSKSHVINKGDDVLEVKVGIGWQGYCQACGTVMLEQASTEALRRTKPNADSGVTID